MDTPDAATTAAPSLFSTRATVSSLATDISELQLDGDVTGDGVHAVGDNAPDAFVRYGLPPTLPLWLHPACSRHIAKGNFLTLSRLPKTVEPGEWLAHQMVEHYMNLCHFVRVVCEKEDDGTSICNAETCPTMSGGPCYTYTWLRADHTVVAVSAREYMSLVQRWVTRLMDDDTLFPTDPDGVSSAAWPGTSGGGGGGGTDPGADPGVPYTPDADSGAADSGAAASDNDWLGRRGGFPRHFHTACRQIARQIARVYAHLYWAHFVDPFYHLSLDKALNSCFFHFVLSTTTPTPGDNNVLYPPLLFPQNDDLAPLLPLLDLWAVNGMCPPRSEAYRFANRAAGRRLLRLGGMVGSDDW